MIPFLIPLLTSLGSYAASKLGNRGSNQSSGQNGQQDIMQLLAQFPELRQALNLQTQQAQRQDPLHEALTRLGMNLLPRTAFSNFANRPGIPVTPAQPTTLSASSGVRRRADDDTNYDYDDRKRV